MATIKLRRAATAGASLPYGEMAIGGNELYFGNISNLPIKMSKDGHTHTAAQVGAMSISHPANAITSTNITNWNKAYGWGNHASVGYITSNGISGMTSGQVAIAGSGSTITGSRAIDATSGGISGSTSLITSGAVFSGLATNYPEIIDLTGGL